MVGVVDYLVVHSVIRKTDSQVLQISSKLLYLFRESVMAGSIVNEISCRHIFWRRERETHGFV